MAQRELELPITGWLGDPTNPPGLAFTSANRPYLTFDAATDELCVQGFILPDDYVGTPVVEVQWGAASATTGDVVWSAEIMAATPNSDTADHGTDSFGTANTVTDSHLGTTAGRLHEASIALTTDTDSMAAGDSVDIRLRRDADNVSDTLAGDVYVWKVRFTYSDS